MSLRHSLIRSFLGVGSVRFISLIGGFLTSILLARHLEPETFGQYAFAMAILPLLTLPASGGLSMFLTREVAGYVHQSEWALLKGLVRSAHLYVLGFSLLILILGKGSGLLFDWVPQEGKWVLVGIVLFLVPVNGLKEVQKGIIKGLGYPAYADLPMQVVQPLIVLLCCFILAWLHNLSSTTAIWSQVFVGVISLLFSSYIYRRLKPDSLWAAPAASRMKQWAVALFPFTLIILMTTMNARVGMVLLGILSTDEAVAAMRVGESGARFISLPLALVNAVIAPHIVNLFKSGDLKKLQHLSRQSARGALALSLPLALVLIFFGKPLIFHIFGPDYAAISYLPLVYLTVAHLISVFWGSVGQMLSMSGNEKDTLMGQMISLMVNGLACVVLIPRYGASGAAAGSALGMIIWNVLLGISVSRKLNIRPTAI